MSGTVLLFLGAGASKPFGVPTMKEMVEEFEKELEPGSEDEKLYEDISVALKNRHGRFDLETVLMVLEALENPDKWHPFAAYVLDKFGKNYNAVIDSKDIINAPILAKKLKDFLSDKCRFNMDEYENNKGLYDTLFQLSDRVAGITGVSTGSSVSAIYTTNYDRYIDSYIRDTYSEAYYYKVRDYFERLNNPETLTFKDEYFSSSYNPPTEFVKIHGSIDWYLDKNRGNLVRTDSPMKTYESGIMIYPTGDKPLYQEPWIKLLLLLKGALSRTSIWIVVGYSFNDEVILNVFKEALSQGKQSGHPKKLFILSKSAEKIKEDHFYGYHEYVTPLPINFQDIMPGQKYYDTLMEIVSNGGRDPFVVVWPKNAGGLDGPRIVVIGNQALHMDPSPDSIDNWALRKNLPRIEISVGESEDKRNKDYEQFVKEKKLSVITGNDMGKNKLNFVNDTIEKYQDRCKEMGKGQYHYL